MFSDKKSKFLFSFVSSVVFTGAIGTEVMAQSTTGADDASGSTTTTDESFTDTTVDTMASGTFDVFPGGTDSSGVGHGYVSCPEYNDGLSPGFPFPGSSSSGPGLAPSPRGRRLLELGYRCMIHTHYGRVEYECGCGHLGKPRQGQLNHTWFVERPTQKARLEGCEELFTQQCGDVSVAAESSCVNDYGSCESVLVQASAGETRNSTLTLRCGCEDLSTWSVDENRATTLGVSAEQLADRCEAEVALCGVSAVGQGPAKGMGLGPARSTNVACSSAFGRCNLALRENGQQQLACGCENGDVLQTQGDLGWLNPDSSTLLSECGQALAKCDPQGAPVTDVGAEPGGTTTGAAILGGSTGTSAQAPDAQAPVQFSCSVGEDSGRDAFALLGFGLLLGLGRRNR